jgi:ribosomal protein S3AE
MSDTVDEAGFEAGQLLNKSKTGAIRERMREFVSEHGESTAVTELREAVASGEDLSDVVVEGRDERL